jgi:bifunctional DNA-binding transcriptional regulator/antitoxin component of YhaV-PrlF toxin-antitoxin module
MTSVTLTAKGEVSLPESVRQRVGIEVGDRLEFIESERGSLVAAATRDIQSLRGIVGRPEKPVPIQNIPRHERHRPLPGRSKDWPADLLICARIDVIRK